MTVGIVLRLVVVLDVGQDLAAVHPRKVQIQQDEIGAREPARSPLAAQERHGLHTVGGHVQVDRHVGR